MSDVTAGIVAHRDREQEYAALYDELADQFPTHLFIDDGTQGCDRNHLRAWETLAGVADTPWCMVLEDDAQPLPELAYHLGQALFYAPAPIVSLYLGRGRPVHWQRRISNAMRFAERPFVVANALLHCVGVAIRTDLVPTLIADAREAVESDVHKPIDEALTEAIRNQNLPVAYTNPSLVQHADQASLAGHDWADPAPEPRVAWGFGTAPTTWTGQFSIM